MLALTPDTQLGRGDANGHRLGLGVGRWSGVSEWHLRVINNNFKGTIVSDGLVLHNQLEGGSALPPHPSFFFLRARCLAQLDELLCKHVYKVRIHD